MSVSGTAYTPTQHSHGNVGHKNRKRSSRAERRKVGVVTKVTAMLQAFKTNIEVPEDLVVPAKDEVLSRTGSRHLAAHAFEIFGVSTDYRSAVTDCVSLAEKNPVFSPIIRKLTRTVAEAETRVVFDNAIFSEEETDTTTKASEIVNKMLARIQWDNRKEEYIRSMLNEGGLSLELVVSNKQDRVDRVEYRPHYSIVPLSNSQGAFEDARRAFNQVDSMGRVLATFALWQLADVNLEESAFHNRGVPHLQAARQLLQYTGMMTKGLMQKWIRESGSIEHFNLEDARKWEEVDRFRRENEETLNASPDNLVRQFFTKGKVEIERITADTVSQDTTSIEFMLDLIFLAAGVAKEILGFKSKVVIKEMIEVAVDTYFQQLQKIQTRLHSVLRKVIDFELLINGIIPEDVPYKIVGGRFEVTRQVKKIPKEAIEIGAVSINDIRRSINLPSFVHPMWDIPGLYNDSITARKIARASGIDLPFDEEELEEIDAESEDTKNEEGKEHERQLEEEEGSGEEEESSSRNTSGQFAAKKKGKKSTSKDQSTSVDFDPLRSLAPKRRHPRRGVVKHTPGILDKAPDGHTNSTRLLSMMLSRNNND